MEQWQADLAGSTIDLDSLHRKFSGIEDLRETAAVYPVRITPHYLSLLRQPGDPIWRQCIPDPRELLDAVQVPDPLNEEGLSPVPGLIHRYPDRVVWLVSGACAVFCRFCMRKRKFGCAAEPIATDVSAVLHYLAGRPSIRDVVLSGGDPLLLDDDRLDDILTRLRQIRHIEIIRIGTRVPVTLPSRITSNLCRMLAKHHPVYVNTHFNHPSEIVGQSAEACRRLSNAGIVLGNQTVLLKGVNDSPAVMAELMRSLLKIRVRPYYLHHMDLVRGTAHFRTAIDEGMRVIDALRGHVSGLAIPHYVVDLPGGKGKVAVLPENVRRDGNQWLLRNYLGEVVEYRDPD